MKLSFYYKPNKWLAQKLGLACDFPAAKRMRWLCWLISIWGLASLSSPALAIAEKPYLVNGSGDKVELMEIKPNAIFSDQKVVGLWMRDLYLKGTQGFSAIIVQPGYCYIGQQLLEKNDVRLTFSAGQQSISTKEAQHGFDLQFKIFNDHFLAGELSCEGFELVVLGSD